MKKVSIGLLGILLCSAALSADAYSESDKLLAEKDFPYPTGGEAALPEADDTLDDASGWGQDQNPVNNGKAGGKSEKEYVPEFENDGDGQ